MKACVYLVGDESFDYCVSQCVYLGQMALVAGSDNERLSRSRWDLGAK